MRLTLDELETERGEVEPFEVELGPDSVITLPHPKDMPFQTLVNFDGNNPAAVLRALMGEESFDVMAGNPRVTLGALEQILTAYYAHYGLGGPGEGGASRPSSNGSARRSRQTSRGAATA